MSDTRKEMLLHEYDELVSYMRTFWTLRTAVLAIGLTLLGLIFSSSTTAVFPSKQACDFSLMILLFAISKMLGSLTRSLYLYTFRLLDISEELKAPGFWKIWPIYLKKNPRDCGSAAYLVLLRFLNIIILLYIISTHSYLIMQGQRVLNIESVISFILILFTLIIFIVNNHIVSCELNPAGFQEKLSLDWKAAAKICTKKWKENQGNEKTE